MTAKSSAGRRLPRGDLLTAEHTMIEMWTDRAESGDAAAQYQLGYCHEMGQGVAVDLEAAVHWYLRAANQGHPRSQYHLGLAFAYGGAGVPWDLSESCKWLTLAARGRIREATAALQLLKATPEQRAVGDRGARAFVPRMEPQAPKAETHTLTGGLEEVLPIGRNTAQLEFPLGAA
jgi:hypothetical protein